MKKPNKYLEMFLFTLCQNIRIVRKRNIYKYVTLWKIKWNKCVSYEHRNMIARNIMGNNLKWLFQFYNLISQAATVYLKAMFLNFMGVLLGKGTHKLINTIVCF